MQPFSININFFFGTECFRNRLIDYAFSGEKHTGFGRRGDNCVSFRRDIFPCINLTLFWLHVMTISLEAGPAHMVGFNFWYTSKTIHLGSTCVSERSSSI